MTSNKQIFLKGNPFEWGDGNASVFLSQHHFQHHRLCLKIKHTLRGCWMSNKKLKVFSCMLPCKYSKLTKFYSTLFCPNQSPSFSPLKHTPHQLPTVHPRLLIFPSTMATLELLQSLKDLLARYFLWASKVFFSFYLMVAIPAISAQNLSTKLQVLSLL